MFRLKNTKKCLGALVCMRIHGVWERKWRLKSEAFDELEGNVNEFATNLGLLTKTAIYDLKDNIFSQDIY